MANSAYQTAPAFIKEVTTLSLNNHKANDIRIDKKATAMYCSGDGNIVYIPHGKTPNFSNLTKLNGVKSGTFTNVLADYVMGNYPTTRGMDQFQEIADTQVASVLTATGTNHVEFVEGTYTVDLDIVDNATDDPNDGTRGTYSFKIIVNSSNTITSIKIQEMALGLESGDDVNLPANTLSSSHNAVAFNLAGQTEVPDGTIVPSAGTTATVQAYR